MKKEAGSIEEKKLQKSKTQVQRKVIRFVRERRVFIFVFVLFLFELFLRFYNISEKNPFGYDQVDNAWAAKNLIVNHRFPLVGMVAKENSGMYIGPAYYYLISVFYWIEGLNPIASGIFAAITSIFTFWTIYYISKRLFSTEVAVIALAINTFCFSAVTFDRIQWPVDFLPAISLLIFYLLYKVMTGDIKKLLWLAAAIGFAFNIHFTAIFFPVIVILSMPLIPWSKNTFKYLLLSFPFFAVWLVPNVIYQLQNKTSGGNYSSYFNHYYHGFHLTRMRQLAGDALIQFNPYLIYDWAANFKFIAVPLFFLLYLHKKFDVDREKLVYLVTIWFLVPWLIFTTYSGEISDYYFATTRFLALLILSYFLYRVWILKVNMFKIATAVFLLIYCWYGFSHYLPYHDPNNLSKEKKEVMQKVNGNIRIEFQEGVPGSYIYYYFMRTLKGKEVY